jgi:MFS family permease
MQSFTLKGTTVWLICAVFFLYEFLLRTVIGTFQHPIMYDLHLSSFKFSILSTTMYLLIYGAMQIPAGLIIDYWGLKRSLVLGAILCSLSSFIFAYADSYGIAMASRLMMGLGSSFGFICLLLSVYEWLPQRRSAFLIGVSQFIGTMGPMLAAGPLEALSQSSHVSWRTVFVVLSAFGFFLTFIIFVFVQNNHQRAGDDIVLKRPEPVAKSIRRLFMSFQPCAIAIFSACIYFTIEYLSENEGKSFIEMKGYSGHFASYMLTLSWFGYALGCPLLGFLSDYFQRRKNILIVAAWCGLFAIMTIVFSFHKIALMVAFFFLGLSASGQSVGFALMSEQFKKQYLAIGLSLNNAVISVLSGINAPIIGWLIDLSSGGGITTLPAYYAAFSVLIIVVAISVLFATFFIKETFCKSAVDFCYLNKKT